MDISSSSKENDISQSIVTVGRRTRIRPGRELDYVAVHATIPTEVADALRRSGIVTWHIWIDGGTLFHSIDTLDGYERFVEEITALGPVNSGWDELIASILDSDPFSDQMLQLVWSMDASGQQSGSSTRPAAPRP